MQAAIRGAMTARDTLGGVIEVAALGLPPGLGSFAQWDRRLEARLGAAVLSVQAIKGVEFGPAFENARLPGTQAHDPIHLEGREITRPSDRSGGLEGGITTGQPLVLRAAMKPIATTLTPQETVNLATGEAAQTQYERSDFCPVPRAVVILEAMVAFVLADALLEKLGGDSLDEIRPRFAALRRPRLDDLAIDGLPHTFWPE
jgi:chorismate synthase